MSNDVLIIAEAGVNHNGSLDLALKLITEAKKAGADVVKFQTFDAAALVTSTAAKAAYQKRNDGESTQFEMLSRLALKAEDFQVLKEACDAEGIAFMSSAFDLKSIDLLESLGHTVYKIPSGEITNLPYLRKIGNLKKEVILSTGMANMSEIAEALDVLVASGTAREKIAVLHCTSEYPAPFDSINLRAMVTLREHFKCKVGYSDHTMGIEASIAAVALGAEVIEKHFTLDRNMTGPDHRASLEPSELRAMVSAIRNVRIGLGSSVKEPSSAEKKNIEIVRKSIVASRSIQKGEVFSAENLTTKRPGNGISPMKWDQLMGKPANRDYSKDEQIVL